MNWHEITYPSDLPISKEIDNIKQLVSANQVVIICGETGSGKTTQLPKMLLQMGYNEHGLIGHTQPRRVAARTIAHRISQELNNQDVVGYKVRFNDKTKPTTAIKLMTDGILLQEIQKDRLLRQYSALIIDEAHERSLNIDFILGYLKTILAKRPELKVIITSATIDNAKLSRFFNSAPAIDIEGKTYPVDIIYQPPQIDDKEDYNLNHAIYKAVASCLDIELGNVLVFLPGEREIKDCISYLRKTTLSRYQLLALFARQNEAEQNQVFMVDGSLKIIVTTNIAETSLTIPGVRFVIDSGLAKVKRYNMRNQVEQLLLEPISKASSTQRTGRAGRVSHGMCIRLFSETEFSLRPQFSDPEIIRVSLANVILKLIYFKLGDPATFPFLDMPETKAFNNGFKTLFQLQAIDNTVIPSPDIVIASAKQSLHHINEATKPAEKSNSEFAITQIGKQIAIIPVDVHLAKILIAAGSEFNCLSEALIIVSFLSIVDPREYPLELQQQAREKQQIWQNKDSDFITILNLWEWYIHELTHKKSNKKLQELCYQHFLSSTRLREWHELQGQLTEVMHNLGYKNNTQTASYQQLHQALLSGLLNNVGQKDLESNEYLGTNSKKFMIHPASLITKPKWVVSALLTMTPRLYARINSKIEPEWAVAVTKHLVKYTYSDERWDKKRGEVIAIQSVLFYGLAIAKSKAAFGKINPSLAREIFIKDGIVPVELLSSYEFIRHNQQVIDNLEKIEDKLRLSLVIIEDELFSFYDSIIPQDICDIRSFDVWCKDNEPQLYLDQEKLINKFMQDNSQINLYPDYILCGTIKLKLDYVFNPESSADGVTTTIFLNQLNQISQIPFTWLVPGLIRDKVNYLIKSLPKVVRVAVNPANEFITEFLSIANMDNSLNQELATYLQTKYKFNLEDSIFNLLEQIELPHHLQFHFQIKDDKKVIATDNDLNLLKTKVAPQLSNMVESLSQEYEVKNITSWDGRLNNLLSHVDLMPESRTKHTHSKWQDTDTSYPDTRVGQNHRKIVGYLSLVVKNAQINLTVLDNLDKAKLNTRKGFLYLIKNHLQEQIKYLEQKKFNQFKESSLYLADIYDRDSLLADSIDFILRMSIDLNQLPKTEQEFNALVNHSRQEIGENTLNLARVLYNMAHLYHEVKLKAARHALEDEILLQLDDLIFTGLLKYTRFNILENFPRYLQAILKRLEKYGMHKDRDWHNSSQISLLYDTWYNRIDKLEETGKTASQEMYDFKYKIEELRVSLFAQELKTPYPVSVKRLSRELDELFAQSF